MSGELTTDFLLEWSIDRQRRAMSAEDRCGYCKPYCATSRWHGITCRSCKCPSSLKEHRK